MIYLHLLCSRIFQECVHIRTDRDPPDGITPQSDMFSVVNMYLDHLKFGVVCIGRYVCCSECNVVSNEPALCNLCPIGTHGG